ncbi:MAG: transcriptional repressor [Desulfovibrio sp.]|nr:transcriptional repressor [Desulfovibrio sp.]
MNSKISQNNIIDTIEKTCKDCGDRLTSLRKSIITLMINENRPLKAYEIIEKMRDNGKRLTPTTVYRVLDFLIEKGFVHRINYLNAFIICKENHKKSPYILFVCSSCENTIEISNKNIIETIQDNINSIGCIADNECIEICGTCNSCLSAKK